MNVEGKGVLALNGISQPAKTAHALHSRPRTLPLSTAEASSLPNIAVLLRYTEDINEVKEIQKLSAIHTQSVPQYAVDTLLGGDPLAQVGSGVPAHP